MFQAIFFKFLGSVRYIERKNVTFLRFILNFNNFEKLKFHDKKKVFFIFQKKKFYLKSFCFLKCKVSFFLLLYED